MPGTLFVVATPIGNLEDVSARALRVLREVALIAAEDTRRTAHLLARYGIPTRTTSLHEHNEDQKADALVAKLEAGRSIALVSDAGTPTISDPGARLVNAAIRAGIRIEAIPGPSAVSTALAASGFPADTYLFLGFPPTGVSARNAWFEQARTAGRTVVFFEAPHRVHETLERLRQVVGDCAVMVSRELTKAHEELVRGPISLVLDTLRGPRGELTIVADLGRTTSEVPELPDDMAIALEVQGLAGAPGLKRRDAISRVARKYGRNTNEIYAAVERGRKLVG
jgi:16S rRNA (cytidine1402-2'-O)-methyltransferase